MSAYQFEATIAFDDAPPADVIRERVYDTVRVTADWAADRVTLRVNGNLDPRDAPAYVELFFHDVFLLLNLASPRSFSGTITTTGGELRVNELTFNARFFDGARLPLAQVTRWYDALQIGTRQVASDGVERALFHLLHLARSAEDEEQSIVRLADAVEGLIGKPVGLERLFALRDEIASGRAPVFHPMHDDALDERVEDATREWLALADAAARAVIRALQARITGGR